MHHNLKLAAAQFSPVRGNVEENTRRHLPLIHKAVQENVDLILFPELSLTGYEPDLAKKLAFSDNDPRLDPFCEAANKQNITIIVGAPIDNGTEKPLLGAFIISPDGTLVHYSKMHFHSDSGEDRYFTPGAEFLLMELKNVPIGLAICADINTASHAANNASAGARVYLSSVLVSEGGYNKDAGNLQRSAQTYNMLALMANYSGPSGGWEAIGRSAAWSPDGELLIQAPEKNDALVIVEKQKGVWRGKTVLID